MNSLKKLIFIILLITSKNSFAQVNSYFEPEKINLNLIDKPFQIGDKNYQKEIKFIVNLQKNINLELLDRAAAQKNLKPETLILEINKNLTRQNFSKLYDLLNKVEITSVNLTKHFKNHFKLTRPYLASAEVQMLISPSKGYAYPSGHTSGSFIYAFILAEIFLDKKEFLLNLADEIANNRILVGMHYPQDIKGGKQLAVLAFEELMQNAEFLQDLENAKLEVKN